MSSETGSLSTDALFVGLTRPPMLFGVSYLYFVVNILVSMVYFINSSDFKVIGVWVITHGVGYLICFKEPRFIEIYVIRGQKCSMCKNKFYHDGNSYDQY